MTKLDFAEALIDSRWETSISGRPNDVPKPTIYREAPEDVRRTSLDEADELVIKDGGTVTYEPKSVGWVEEEVRTPVLYDIRTTKGRTRYEGERQTSPGDPLGDAPRYGGLVGEVKRIIDTARKGEKEFDLVTASEFNNLTPEMGGQVWRGQYTVYLEQRAAQIDPTP